MASTFEEFEAAEDRKSPKGTVRLFLEALHLLEYDRDTALEALTLFLPKGSLNAVAGSRTGFSLGSGDMFYVDQLTKRPQIVRSYLGGTPENDYSCPTAGEPAWVDEAPTTIGEKEAKIFVRSAGKDFPTPLTLKRNKAGYWKVFNWSSVATGVKKAVAGEDDDF